MFTSKRKAMSVLAKDSNDSSGNTLFIKGAAERLIDTAKSIMT